MSLGTETSPSRFGLCNVSHASDFDIGFYVAFIHLYTSFTWIWITWMIFLTFASNHFLCFNVVNTLIKGEIVKIKLI